MIAFRVTFGGVKCELFLLKRHVLEGVKFLIVFADDDRFRENTKSDFSIKKILIFGAFCVSIRQTQSRLFLPFTRRKIKKNPNGVIAKKRTLIFSRQSPHPSQCF